MHIPTELEPVSMKWVEILSRGVLYLRSIELPHSYPVFEPWVGDSGVCDNVVTHSKPILNFRGEPLVAELVIQRLFAEAGWESVWAESYPGGGSRVYLFRDIPCGDSPLRESLPIEILPPHVRKLLDEIRAKSGSTSLPDVLAWTEDRVMFIESKREGMDMLRPSQFRFILTAYDCGVPLSDILIVQWKFAP